MRKKVASRSDTYGNPQPKAPLMFRMRVPHGQPIHFEKRDTPGRSSFSWSVKASLADVIFYVQQSLTMSPPLIVDVSGKLLA